MALLKREIRQFGVEIAYLEADVEKEPCIELPDGHRNLRNQLG